MNRKYEEEQATKVAHKKIITGAAARVLRARMDTRPPTAHIAPFGLRMQPELRRKLEEAAIESGRSMNSEIHDRLEKSFESTGALDEKIEDALRRILSEYVITKK